MSDLEQRYLKAVRQRVCHHCSDLMTDGICGLADRVCPIELNLREMIQIVHYVHDEAIEPYLRNLRKVVCAACGTRDLADHCRLKDQRDCALDRFFVLVVEAINDVHEDLREEAKALVH